MRSAPGGVRRAWGPGRGSVSFAERLVGRYVHRAAGAPATRVMLRGVDPRRSVGTSRIELRLAVRVSAPGGGASSPDRSVVRGGPAASLFHAASPTTAGALAGQVVGPVERVLARAKFLEGASAARPTPPYTFAPAPVQRVVRRGAPLPDVARARSGARAAEIELDDLRPGRDFRAQARAPSSPLLSAPDLERVTTRVVDALDRRLAAFRERRGRV